MPRYREYDMVNRGEQQNVGANDHSPLHRSESWPFALLNYVRRYLGGDARGFHFAAALLHPLDG